MDMETLNIEYIRNGTRCNYLWWNKSIIVTLVSKHVSALLSTQRISINIETKGNPIIIKWDVNLFPILHVASYIESSLVEAVYQDWEYPDYVKVKSETSLLLSCSYHIIQRKRI